MFQILRPRAFAALGVTAACLTLLLLLTTYGSAEAGATDLGTGATVASWFVGLLGAGAYVLVLVPLVWSVHVYFHERTPELHMRAVGTLMLAAATAALVGVLNAGESAFWAGTLGTAYGAWVAWMTGVFGAGIGYTLGWALAVFFWLYAVVLATDWMFHSIRRGDPLEALKGDRRIEIEPLNVELRDEGEEPAERAFVSADAPVEIEADERYDDEHDDRPIVVSDEEEFDFAADSPDEAAPVATWSEPVAETAKDPEPVVPARADLRVSHDRSGRTFVRVPSGYKGVEFLPPSDELADPAPPVELRHPSASDVEVQAAFEPWMDVVMRDGELDGSRTEEPVETALHDVDRDADSLTVTAEADTTGARAPSIGYPDDDLLVDEVFSVERMFDHVQGFRPAPASPAPHAQQTAPARAEGASDGASAAQELAETFAPAPAAAATSAPSAHDSPYLVDEVFDAGIALVSLDDVVIAADAPRRAPEAPAAPAAPPATEPRPSAAAPRAESPDVWQAQVAAPDVAGLHGIGLDPLFRESVTAILNRGRASAVVLQSQLGIGYSRANRILDQMTEIGVTGPETPTGSREIRLPEADLRRFLGASA